MALYTGRYTLEDASAAPEICHEWHLPRGLMADPAARASVTAQAALLQPWVWGEGEDRYPRQFYFYQAGQQVRDFQRNGSTRPPCPLLLPKESKAWSMSRRGSGITLSWLTVHTPISNNLHILLFHIRMCDSDLWKYILPRRRPLHSFHTKCQLLSNSVYLPSYLSALHILASDMD